jgi:glyoxylate/hydroxypyruvate reductase A
MALLIETGQPDWMTNEALRDALRPLLPKADIRCAPDLGEPAEIIMLACSRLLPGLVSRLPGLRLVQKLGAGVETIVADPDLPPGVRVARLKPDAAAQEIAEYCLAYVLREQRNMAFHAERQRARVAAAFAALGFRVIGWSRGPKELPGIDCRHGPAALRGMLGECDFVCSVLPSTPETRDLADAGFFAAMKRGAMLINVGRGDLVVETDLVAALDSGHLAGAVLDVFRAEPLPPGHPFWLHPGITVTPHVSGWRVTGGLETVAANYRRLLAGEPLLHEVDRAAGY